MSWLVVALLAATAPDACGLLDERTRELRRSAMASEAELAQAEARFEADLGRPLLREPERAIPAQIRADLTVQRAKSACAFKARLSGVSEPRTNRQKLQEILDRPEFAGARIRDPGFMARWLQVLAEWLRSLFEGDSAASFAIVTRAVVLALAVSASALGLLQLARRRRARTAPPAIAPMSTPRRLEDPSAHLSLAEAAVGTDAREAIRQGLLALLSWLEQHRLVRPDRVKTNRELARDLPARGASSELAEAVSRMLRWYDRAFYSLSPVVPQQAREFIREIASLQAQSPRGTP